MQQRDKLFAFISHSCPQTNHRLPVIGDVGRGAWRSSRLLLLEATNMGYTAIMVSMEVVG